MKYVFFLNGQRGLFILKKLIKSKKFDLSKAVICNKDITQKLKNIINKKKIVFIKNINSKKSFKVLKKLNTDIFVVSGYPQIFKRQIFKLPKVMTINLHGGPLPCYKGGSPLNWQIINNEKKIGISIIKMKKGIDTGPVILEEKFKLNKSDTISDIHLKANKYFYVLLLKTLKLIEKKGSNIIFKKSKGKSKYWKQRNDQDGYIIAKQYKQVKVYNFIRAITKPYPGAWTKLNFKNKIRKIRLFSSCITKKKINFLKNDYMLKKNKLYLKCSNGNLRITSYKFFK